MYEAHYVRALIGKLASQGAIFGFGAALNSIAGVILIPFYMRYLSASEYGVFALFELVLLVLFVFFGMGLNITLLSRWHKIAEADKSRLAGSLVSCAIISIFTSGVLITVFAAYMFPSLRWQLLGVVFWIILF